MRKMFAGRSETMTVRELVLICAGVFYFGVPQEFMTAAHEYILLVRDREARKIQIANRTI